MSASRQSVQAKYRASEKYKRTQSAWYERFKSDPSRMYNKLLRSKYGVSLEEMRQMFANQEGLCAVCSRAMCACLATGGRGSRCVTRACVDHDHATGKVRGLLCLGCNVGIGHMKDSAFALRNAAQYLEGVA